MHRRLNLYKAKLPKIKRKASDDDVYIRGMYNPFLDTTGCDVEVIHQEGKTTAEKGVLADNPDVEGIGWIFDSEVQDYESLLKDGRNKLTQTFRYMMKQNSISSSSDASQNSRGIRDPSPPSSMPSGLPNNISRSTSKSSDTKSQMMEEAKARETMLSDVRRLEEFSALVEMLVRKA